jgi:hypothetical protein
MRNLALALCVLMLPAVGQAEEVYRWTDEGGTRHYTNVVQNAPEGADVVDTIVTLEVDRLPGAHGAEPTLELQGGQVHDGGRHPIAQPVSSAPRHFEALPDAPRIYDEQRLRFGCFSAGVLYYGGFSHADDISPVMNCYPYRLGPRAWLNAAKAELAMRENGINPRDMMQIYQEHHGTQP